MFSFVNSDFDESDVLLYTSVTDSNVANKIVPSAIFFNMSFVLILLLILIV